jgi:hypothetical protein
MQDEVNTSLAKEELLSEVVAEELSDEIPVDQKKDESTNEIMKGQPNDEVEEVAVNELVDDELVTFDYSAVKKDLKKGKINLISSMNIQKIDNEKNVLKSELVTEIKNKKTSFEENIKKLSSQNKVEKLEEDQNYENRIVINAVGTDFLSSQKLLGFEVRPQDDNREAYADYNSGEVVIDEKLDSSKMNRTVSIVKRGYAPTTTDLILEEGVSEITVPLITDEALNELLSPYGSSNRIGVVLVELDENTESASLDVPYYKEVKLDENMREVTSNDYSYIMYIGVKAGNVLLSYSHSQGETISKIIHVHEHELTFDSNFYEDVVDEKVTFVEEDLLSKDKAPLILSEVQVNHFAKKKSVIKTNQNSFKTDFVKTSLGGRKYLELGHLFEPIFVGYKETKKLEIPSENYMRFLLSSLKTQKLENRCLIQINLTKKASLVDLGAESVGQSLETKLQVIDEDGKFYESLSSKSQKIIISGEFSGNEGDNPDSKINIKITYQDKSIQYFSSYCSPNTYLVEQL